MNKLSYIIITLILILLIVIGVTVYTRSNSSTPNTPISAVPTATYTDLNIALKNSQGQTVTTNNFLKDQTVISDTQNPGLYSLGNTFPTNQNINNSPNYVVTFEEKTGYFNITLLNKPLRQARQEAEAYLKNFLKLDETQLCNLSYSVSVPGFVDTDASGVDYRFSFCSDTVPL